MVYRICISFLMISFGCLLVVCWLPISFYWTACSIDVIGSRLMSADLFCLLFKRFRLDHIFVWRLRLLCSSIDFWWFPIDFWWCLFRLLLVAYWLLLVSCWFQSLLNWCSASFLLGFKRCLVAAFHSFGLTLHVRSSLIFFTFVRNLRFSSIRTPNQTNHLVLQGIL